MSHSRFRLLTLCCSLAPLCVVLSSCSSSKSMPDAAILYADPETQLYTSPPCIERNPDRFASFTEEIIKADVSASWEAWRGDRSVRRLQADPWCRDQRFGGVGPLASGGFTETVYIFQGSSRWNEDGTWNW